MCVGLSVYGGEAYCNNLFRLVAQPLYRHTLCLASNDSKAMSARYACEPTPSRGLSQWVTLYNHADVPFRYRLTQNTGTTESVLDPHTHVSICAQTNDQWIVGVSVSPKRGTSPASAGSMPSLDQLRAQGVSKGTFHATWYIRDNGISSSQGMRS